jgi:hypothetical protein
MHKAFYLIVLFAVLFSKSNAQSSSFVSVKKDHFYLNDLPSDKQATKQTIALYHNLKTLLNKGIMLGHQDDLAYGVGWKYVEGKSDVKKVTGDYPAL